MVERILLALIRSEVDRLKEDRTELSRFFKHFFDPTAGEEAREEFVTFFIKNPPVTVLGYPRTTADFPCFSVVLENDEEVEPGLLGHYVGTTQPDEMPDDAEDNEYEGAFFEQSFGVYIYAENPDVCAYLYQFLKLTLFGSRLALEQAGLLNIHYSGGELTPQEYLPENMFARVLHMKCQSMMTIPKLLSYKDGRKLRVTGVFREDVVVDGVPGGVVTIPKRCEDDE